MDSWIGDSLLKRPFAGCLTGLTGRSESPARKKKMPHMTSPPMTTSSIELQSIVYCRYCVLVWAPQVFKKNAKAQYPHIILQQPLPALMADLKEGRRTLVSTPRTDLRVLETLCFLYLPSVEFLWANMIKLPGVLEIQDKPLEISSRSL